jgi:hypothetical protein
MGYDSELGVLCLISYFSSVIDIFYRTSGGEWLYSVNIMARAGDTPSIATGIDGKRRNVNLR